MYTSVKRMKFHQDIFVLLYGCLPLANQTAPTLDLSDLSLTMPLHSKRTAKNSPTMAIKIANMNHSGATRPSMIAQKILSLWKNAKFWLYPL